MDPKFFSAGQQNMTPQQQQSAAANARMMMAFQQQQQQQQQSQQPNQEQYGSMTGDGSMHFNGTANMDAMAFSQTDMNAFDQTTMAGMNPFLNQQNMMTQLSSMNPLAQQNVVPQQQPTSQQQPQNFAQQQQLFGPGMPNQFQQRGLYQNNGDMMSPQALMYQQQQQQQQQQQHMALNRVKQQSPSQSPAIGNAHYQNQGASSVMAGSPNTGRMPSSEYPVSSPVSSQAMFSQASQMNRVIPSQSVGRYMPHANSPMMQNNAGASPSNRQLPSHQASPQISNNFAQPSPAQNSPVAPSAVPQRSATPGSTTSTPMQQHQQLESKPEEQPPSETKKQETPQKSPTPKANSQAEKSAESISQRGTPEHPDKENVKLVTYMPKTRNVETYGGVDLKYFDKFDIKPLIPHSSELGNVDIHALIMSLKSGLKMEVTNALNIMSVVTAQQMMPLTLSFCEDLVDVLLDYLEADILRTGMDYDDHEETPSPRKKRAARSVEDDYTYSELFDMSLDEMKSLIPTLENTTSDLWLSLRERSLCIFNILRNLSFMPDNMEYLAKHSRFVDIMARIVVAINESSDVFESDAWFVGVRRMDTLDFRKSVLIILSNISMLMVLRRRWAEAFLELIHDFISHGPDTYYSLLATETWAKLAVNYDNRKVFASLPSRTTLQDIWIELAAMIRRDYFSSEGRVLFNITANQLATLEYALMGLYNIVCITVTDQEPLPNRKVIAMTILRLAVTMAESGLQHFYMVTRRGMELIRVLVCGTTQDRQSSRAPHEEPDENEGRDLSLMASQILDVTSVRDMLMRAMLRPTMDVDVLRDLSDLVSSIDGDE
ncbi:hypothetical protein BCR43DRAFT_485855 [Syncephalastrum racemosum]|uniref:SWI/SNF-like complex subunit BAF250 C-terminal domain-containing protein n=1 Tax=Syncephalastrum racemosum TaxID=13706 RepID=A0A1X2HNB3_SYNRA|nr:hypothetical protein BCR43DRAFT_485855 [Syncephalastrum racemosum]